MFNIFLLVISPRNNKVGGICLCEITNKKKIEKYRDYTFLLYPESCDKNWSKTLSEFRQPMFYILHDKDYVIHENGEIEQKKPHYHVHIMFDNPRTPNTILDLILRCGGNPYIEKVRSRRGCARYLTHMDDPDKFQYSFSEVHALCGADYSKVTKSASERENDRVTMIIEILEFIDENQIHIYSDLIKYSAKNKPEWISLLFSYTCQIVKDYIRSEAFAFKEKRYGNTYNRLCFELEQGEK